MVECGRGGEYERQGDYIRDVILKRGKYEEG
jgi:hypothetical protein